MVTPVIDEKLLFTQISRFSINTYCLVCTTDANMARWHFVDILQLRCSAYVIIVMYFCPYVRIVMYFCAYVAIVMYFCVYVIITIITVYLFQVMSCISVHMSYRNYMSSKSLLLIIQYNTCIDRSLYCRKHMKCSYLQSQELNTTQPLQCHCHTTTIHN